MSLTDEQQKSYEKTKTCYICRKEFQDNYSNDKKYRKTRDHCHFTGEYRGASHSMYSSKYNTIKEISVGFHNGLNYDYNFIIKELPQNFEGKSNYFRENTKKCKAFSVPVKKEIKGIGTNGEEITKAISYKVKFIDSAGFTASSSSNLVDNLAEGIHKIKRKYEYDHEHVELNTKIVSAMWNIQVL